MANLCGNQLRVRGPEEDIDRFVKVAVVEDAAEEVVFDEFDGCVTDCNERQVEIAFLSRHSPPLRFLVDLSRQYPILTFYLEWDEGGVGLFGAVFVEAGEGISVEQGFCHERWRIPDDLPESATESTAIAPVDNE